jgi:hypothetical protein
VREVSDELGCDWHTTNDTLLAYGEALLEADTDRVAATDALGLDEVLAWRAGPRRSRRWATTIVDVPTTVGKAQLIDIVEGRAARPVLDWLDGADRGMAGGAPLGRDGPVRPLPQGVHRRGSPTPSRSRTPST